MISTKWTSRIRFFLPWIVIGAVALVVSFPLLKEGLIDTHDSPYAVLRADIVYKNFNEQGYPRWAPDMEAGYGYPMFNFYPPLFSFGAALFMTVGFGAVSAVQFFAAFLWLFSGVFFFLWLAPLIGRRAATIGSVAYMCAPYHIIQVYVRGSFAEFAALTVLPLLLWALSRIAQEANFRNIALGAVSIALLIVSHNAIALIAFPLVFLYGIAAARGLFENNEKKERTQKSLRAVFVSFFLGLSLASFYWLPALFESAYTHVSIARDGYFSFNNHFVSLFELVVSEWSFGDKVSHMIGPIHVLFALFSVVLLFLPRVRQTKGAQGFIVFWGGALLAYVFLMTKAAWPLYESFTILSMIQFPWRMLSVTALVSSVLLAAFFALSPRGGKADALYTVTLLFLIIMGVAFSVPRGRFDFVHPHNNRGGLPQEVVDFYETGSAIRGFVAEFTPVWVTERPYAAKAKGLTVAEGFSGEGTVFIKKEIESAVRHAFLVEVSGDMTLVFGALYFPGWNVKVNGESIHVRPSSEGLIEFDVPSGKSDVSITFGKTPIRLWSEVVSLAALLATFGIAVYVRKKRPA